MFSCQRKSKLWEARVSADDEAPDEALLGDVQRRLLSADPAYDWAHLEAREKRAGFEKLFSCEGRCINAS